MVEDADTFEELPEESEEPAVESFGMLDLSLTTALVVEDQPQILALIVDCMRVLGVGHVLPAVSVAAAMEVVNNIQKNPSRVGVSHIDFAIVDWNLSGSPFRRAEDDDSIQGPELCQWLRQVEFCRFMPILAVSAYASKDCVREMLDAGVSNFVSKPFSIREFSLKIQSMVSKLPTFVITPSEYFGPDRRRRNERIEEEKRRTQNGVKKFNPPRSLREKTSTIVKVSENDISKIMKQMREVAPPNYRRQVMEKTQEIEKHLDSLPTEIEGREAILQVRKTFDQINRLCNEVLENPGGFTYQMVAETLAVMSRFIADDYFMPTLKSHSMMKQQLATLSMIVERDMKGVAYGGMRDLFSETFRVIEQVLRENKKNGLSLWIDAGQGAGQKA